MRVATSRPHDSRLGNATRLALLLLRTRVARFHRGRNSAAWTKFSAYHAPHRFRRAHYAVEHAVDDVLLEDAEIAISLQIFFQRLQLHAVFVRHVANRKV